MFLENKKETSEAMSRIYDPNVLDLINNDAYEKEFILKFLEKNQRFKLVKMLGPKESFGEICFRENGNRNATVICGTDCEFATLDNSVSIHC